MIRRAISHIEIPRACSNVYDGWVNPWVAGNAGWHPGRRPLAPCIVDIGWDCHSGT